MFKKALVFIFCIFLLLNSQNLLSQEICDNGIDDDSDGLIDLNDTSDCKCNLHPEKNTVLSLIENPSFEEKDCCPKVYSQIFCTKYWITASKNTPDYYNKCDFTQAPDFRPPPQAGMHGDAYAGYINEGINSPNYKEYIGSCLKKPMPKGVPFHCNFSIAYAGGHTTTTVALYGAAKCSSMPYGGADHYFGCPTNAPDWVLLDEITIDLDTNKWNKGTFNFTPNKNISAVVIGPSCKLEAPTSSQFNYYYFDNLILNTKESFSSLTDTGSQCLGDLTLLADSKSKSFQWYKDGVAILGEIDSSYRIPLDSFGKYSVRLHYDSGCSIESKVINKIPQVSFDLGNDTTICEGESVLLKRPFPCYNSIWYDGTSDSIKKINSAGIYWLEMSNECGKIKDSIQVVIDDCSLFIPNVFTPGKDGSNDLFKFEQGKEEPVDGKIVNRWGQIIYSFNIPGDGFWNGKVNNKDAECPNGTYFYTLHFKTSDRTVNGVITLLRE